MDNSTISTAKHVHFESGPEVYDILVEIDILQNTMDANGMDIKSHKLVYFCKGLDIEQHQWIFSWGNSWFSKGKNVEEVLCLALIEGRRMINQHQKSRSNNGEATGDFIQRESSERPRQD